MKYEMESNSIFDDINCIMFFTMYFQMTMKTAPYALYIKYMALGRMIGFNAMKLGILLGEGVHLTLRMEQLLPVNGPKICDSSRKREVSHFMKTDRWKLMNQRISKREKVLNENVTGAYSRVLGKITGDCQKLNAHLINPILEAEELNNLY